MTANVAKLVHFGRGGDTVHFAKGHECSGYGSPENPHAACNHGDTVIPDGCPVVDVREAVETTEGYKWVFKGPMVNVDLADDEVDECPIPSPLFASAMVEGGGSFGGLLAIHAAQRAVKQRSGLDSVSIREYLDGWREHGARIGEYQNGKIVWFD